MKSEYGFFNTMYYVDAQINEFMQNARKEPWFDNTIFIFTADHANHAEVEATKEIKNVKVALNEFHIPLIIYAPKILVPQKIDKIGSHADILASLTDILGWKNSFTTISSSLFDASVKERFAFVKRGNEVALTDGKATVHYNFKNFMDSEGNNSAKLQELLLGIDTAQANLLKQTKWMQ